MPRKIVNAIPTYQFDYLRPEQKHIGSFLNNDFLKIKSEYMTLGEYVAGAKKFCVYNRLSHDPVGEISDAGDLDWIRQAIYADPKYPILTRIHQLGIRDENYRYLFYVEVISGSDAKFHISNENREFWIEFSKQHWWKFIIGLAALWLWI